MVIKVVHHEYKQNGEHIERELKGEELEKWIEEHVNDSTEDKPGSDTRQDAARGSRQSG